MKTRNVFGVLAIIFGLAGISEAKAEGFKSVGLLDTPRVAPTGSLLPNGKVLIAGGTNIGERMLNSAEIYDPKTGTFTLTGPMSRRRTSHTATLLASGKVLVVGGANWNGPDGVAELYDPATGTFATTGALQINRRAHTATLLQDGRVLIAGGIRDGNKEAAEAEIYDPASGTFGLTGSMVVPRDGHAAALLNDGRVLFVGQAVNFGGGDSAEIYDPKTGKFELTGSLIHPMALSDGTQALTLVDGRVLAIGGTFYGQEIDPRTEAEVYDPKTGHFTVLTSLPNAQAESALSLLPDGTVLFSGGENSQTYPDGNYLSTGKILDPSTGTFRMVPGYLSMPRTYITPVSLPDGSVLLVGGITGTDTIDVSQSVDLYLN